MLAEAEDPGDRLLMGSKTKEELMKMASDRNSGRNEQQPSESQTSERRLTLRPLEALVQHRSGRRQERTTREDESSTPGGAYAWTGRVRGAADVHD